jgi:GNAT superfamily N-acetyltransferase
MPTLTVEAVDPLDESALRDWFSIRAAASEVDDPSEPEPDFDEFRGGLSDAYQRSRLLIAVAGPFPAAAAQVQISVDSPQVACVRLTVHPAQRRRGIGSALLAAAESWAVGVGAGMTVCESTQWRGTQPVPALAFVARHGYVRGRVAPRRELRLPVPVSLFDVPGYSVRTWADRCPDELIEAKAGLNRVMSAEDDHWDVERIRADETRRASQGRSVLTTGALDASGELVAFTSIGRARSPVAFQWETVVAPGHRRRRLATLVKRANLVALAGRWPEVERVTAFNDSTNAPMIAINEALGFQVVAEVVDWEKSLRC